MWLLPEFKVFSFNKFIQIFLFIFIFNLIQFAPTYHDYVLYNHGDGDEGTTKYRARTFVPTGPEMDTVRRNKQNHGNKSDDVQLSSSPSSVGTTQNSGGNREPPKSEALGSSSLLRSEANSAHLPYDLSLMDVDLSNYPKKVVPANEAGKR